MSTQKPGTMLASGLCGTIDEAVLAVAGHGFWILYPPTSPCSFLM
jgi:hypothetical protein